MLAIWLVLVVLFGALADNFLSVATFAGLANRIPALAIVAAGMTLVIISGGIDLSVGSVLGLSGAVLGTVLVDWHQPMWVATCFALGTGLAAGTVNGLVTVWCGVPSFIVTLGMLEIARGLAYLTTQSQTRYIGSAVEGLSAPIAGLAVSSASLIAVLVIAAAQVVLSRTVFGRHVVAIGTNESAVRLAGIDPRPPRIAVFAALGAMTGLAAVFYTSRLGSSDPNAGAGLELSAIAAVVIGGTSLRRRTRFGRQHIPGSTGDRDARSRPCPGRRVRSDQAGDHRCCHRPGGDRRRVAASHQQVAGANAALEVAR